MSSQMFCTKPQARTGRIRARGVQRKNERDTTMKKTTKNTGIKVSTSVKAGGIMDRNHNRIGLKVKTAIKSGGIMDRNPPSRCSLR